MKSCQALGHLNPIRLSGFIAEIEQHGMVAVAKPTAEDYDTLDRLATAQSQATSGGDCWGQSFGYDCYANLTGISVTQCTAPAQSLGINTANNRVTNTGYA